MNSLNSAIFLLTLSQSPSNCPKIIEKSTNYAFQNQCSKDALKTNSAQNWISGYESMHSPPWPKKGVVRLHFDLPVYCHILRDLLYFHQFCRGVPMIKHIDCHRKFKSWSHCYKTGARITITKKWRAVDSLHTDRGQQLIQIQSICLQLNITEEKQKDGQRASWIYEVSAFSLPNTR